MDIGGQVRYPKSMLNGIRIYSSDPIWQQILGDLNATVVDAPGVTDVNFDVLDIHSPISVIDLKAAVLAAADASRVVADIFGRPIAMPPLHQNIVALLHKSGGMSVAGLRNALGYAPGATTHAVETAIYQLRRAHGHDFIENDNGVYKIGRI